MAPKIRVSRIKTAQDEAEDKTEATSPAEAAAINSNHSAIDLFGDLDISDSDESDEFDGSVAEREAAESHDDVGLTEAMAAGNEIAAVESPGVAADSAAASTNEIEPALSDASSDTDHASSESSDDESSGDSTSSDEEAEKSKVVPKVAGDLGNASKVLASDEVYQSIFAEPIDSLSEQTNSNLSRQPEAKDEISERITEEFIGWLNELTNSNLSNQSEVASEISDSANRSASTHRADATEDLQNEEASVESRGDDTEAGSLSRSPNEEDSAEERRDDGDDTDFYVAWTEEEKDKLIRLVRGDALRRRMQRNREEQKRVADRLGRIYVLTEAERVSLEAERRRLKLEVETLSSISDAELHSNLNEEHNWQLISQELEKSNAKPRVCELMWRTCLHPLIVDRSWTAKEDAALMQLVADKHAAGENGIRWDDVADEMPIAYPRTGYQCYTRYGQVVAETNASAPAVAGPCKNSEQRLEGYVRSGRSGFSPSEDLAILAGVRLFGESAWKSIAGFLPRRSPSQLRSRFRDFKVYSWSTDENRRLVKLAESHRGQGKNAIVNWAAVARGFDGPGTFKPARQCRKQFAHIYRAFKKRGADFRLESLEPNEVGRRFAMARERQLDAALEDLVATRELAAGEANRAGVTKNTLAFKGWYTTEKGTPIPKQVLADFLLASSQASATAKLDAADVAGKGKPGTRRLAADVAGKSKPGRRRLAAVDGPEERELAEAFRPTWVGPHTGRPRRNFHEEELTDLGARLSLISKALSFDVASLTEERVEAMDCMEQQAAEALLSRSSPSADGGGRNSRVDRPALEPCASSSKAPPPNTDAADEILPSDANRPLVLPPNQATLVGARGLALYVEQLQSAGRDSTATATAGMALAEESSGNDGDGAGPHEKEKERRAEELLSRRMKSLFTMPLLMSEIDFGESAENDDNLLAGGVAGRSPREDGAPRPTTKKATTARRKASACPRNKALHGPNKRAAACRKTSARLEENAQAGPKTTKSVAPSGTKVAKARTRPRLARKCCVRPEQPPAAAEETRLLKVENGSEIIGGEEEEERFPRSAKRSRLTRQCTVRTEKPALAAAAEARRLLNENNGVKINDGVKVNNSVKINNGVKSSNSVKFNNGVKSNNGVKINNGVKVNNGVKSNNGVKANNGEDEKEEHLPRPAKRARLASLRSDWDEVDAEDDGSEIPEAQEKESGPVTTALATRDWSLRLERLEVSAEDDGTKVKGQDSPAKVVRECFVRLERLQTSAEEDLPTENGGAEIAEDEEAEDEEEDAPHLTTKTAKVASAEEEEDMEDDNDEDDAQEEEEDDEDTYEISENEEEDDGTEDEEGNDGDDEDNEDETEGEDEEEKEEGDDDDVEDETDGEDEEEEEEEEDETEEEEEEDDDEDETEAEKAQEHEEPQPNEKCMLQ